MATRLTATEFHARDDRPDWRYALGRIEACFRCGSFEAAADLARSVAAAAERAGHHPDLDIRYPDRLHVVLTTHADDAVTDLDVDLAGEVSTLAGEAGATSVPTDVQALEIAIDALDTNAVLPFWRAVLGYVDARPDGDGRVRAIVDRARLGPTVWFQEMDTARPQRNRIHLDVTVAHDVAEERVAAALAAGGTLVSDAQAKAFWVLADAEGNEACVCTWQDRA
ncbi:MAG: VOC family protein [Desertimonas sp.]